MKLKKIILGSSVPFNGGQPTYFAVDNKENPCTIEFSQGAVIVTHTRSGEQIGIFTSNIKSFIPLDESKRKNVLKAV